MLKLGKETLQDMWKLLGRGNSPFEREDLHLFGQKLLSKEERGELGAVKTQVIMLEKTVPYKCCFPSLNISVEDFDTDVLFNYCHKFPGTLCDIYWIWTKCKQKRYLIDKEIWGKMGGIYGTYVADVDKRQWHVGTPVWSFNIKGKWDFLFCKV